MTGVVIFWFKESRFLSPLIYFGLLLGALYLWTSQFVVVLLLIHGNEREEWEWLPEEDKAPTGLNRLNLL